MQTPVQDASWVRLGATGVSRDRLRPMGRDLGLDLAPVTAPRLLVRSEGAGRHSTVLRPAADRVAVDRVVAGRAVDSTVAAGTAIAVAVKSGGIRCAFYWSKTTRISSGS